jgi:TolA-binding protein
MKYEIILVLAIAASVFSFLALVGQNSLNAQNVTNMTNGTSATNATTDNMTGGSTHISTAKMQIEEGIKALQAGDNNSARTHLDAAHHELELVFENTITLPTAGASANATKHFDEGMEALQTGDTNEAITDFTAADQALG